MAAGKTYRNGKLTGAAFVRGMRMYDHQLDGLYFQEAFAKTPEEKENIRIRIEAVNKVKNELYEEYKQGR